MPKLIENKSAHSSVQNKSLKKCHSPSAPCCVGGKIWPKFQATLNRKSPFLMSAIVLFNELGSEVSSRDLSPLLIGADPLKTKIYF